MPLPYKTTLSDRVGPIQQFPFKGALEECIDLTFKDAYWCFSEDDKKLVNMIIQSGDMLLAEAAYCGVRIVVANGTNYMVLAMSLSKAKNHETPEQAYDRAMSIIGKR